MTPTEFLNLFIEHLKNAEGEKTPEALNHIAGLQAVADSDNEELKTATMRLLLAPVTATLQKKVETVPTEKKVTAWDRTKQTFNLIRQEYPKYKEFATKGVAVGAIFLVVVTIFSLFLNADTFTASLIANNTSGNSTGLLNFLHLDRVIVCVLYFRWLIFLVTISFFIIRHLEEEAGMFVFYFKKFGVEALILFIVYTFIFANYSILYMNFKIALIGVLNFLGWCAVWGLVIYFIFNRAKVGSEAKLYFATFGIELIINTVRLYILFVLLYIPIFIGAVFYVSSQGGNFDESYSSLPYDVASFWGWWIPAILASINLAISLGIFLGWNAPVTGIKLSFDARDMTSEEKDFMIGFYRKLVESGRENEKVFKSWNIIESSGVFAFTYGENLFISRGAFQERYFNALVAHEIGHLHQRDGLVLQALHSFTYPFFNHLLFNPTTIQRGTIEQDKDFSSSKSNFLLSGIISSMTITFFTLAFGGWSVQALARFWSRFYIDRDYLADDYAVKLGFGYELLNYLESYKDFDTSLPLFSRWRGYTRVRIERIKSKMEMSY